MITTGTLTEIKSFIPETKILETESESGLFGNGGSVTIFPDTEEEVANLLKFANENIKKVNVVSGGTKRGFGGIHGSADFLLSLKNFKGVVEHIPGDMTITVKPGTPFKEIQDYLAKFNQRIALDPFLPEQATIGGIISANDSGPKRLGYGSARDSVIGLRVVYPNGTIIRTGGKVVKNVAGYDMNKLFIGAMGTLGVISEITLKLRPLPKYESLVLLKFPETSIQKMKAFAIHLLDSTVEPVAIELLTPSKAEKLKKERKYIMAISFEDVESSVKYQEEFVRKHQPEETEIEILSLQDAQEFWAKVYNQLPNAQGSVPEGSIEAILKVGTANTNVIELLHHCQEAADLHNLRIEANGGLGHGLSQIILNGSQEDVVMAIRAFRERATQLGGYAVVRHLPAALREKVDVWGEKPQHQFLLDGIKTKIDPNHVLNPGRFVGGI